jgi:hypothetical protein
MVKLLALLVFPVFLMAASWDGTKGPFSFVTITLPGSDKMPPGLPIVPGVPQRTWIPIRTSDPSISGVRVTIIRKDGGTERLLSDFSNGTAGVVTFSLESEIADVKLTELRDGASH